MTPNKLWELKFGWIIRKTESGEMAEQLEYRVSALVKDPSSGSCTYGVAHNACDPICRVQLPLLAALGTTIRFTSPLPDNFFFKEYK